MKTTPLLILLFLSFTASNVLANDSDSFGDVTLEANADELERELSFSYGVSDELPKVQTEVKKEDLPDFDLEEYMNSL